MLIQTHLIITIFFILLLINKINPESKLLFILIALIATYIPDIDTRTSKLGKKKSFRPLQWIFNHRGFLHSFSFLIIIIGILYYFSLIDIMYGFLLGYGLHLIVDGFTKQGIRPFYPYKRKISWRIRTGKRFETAIFVIFLLGSLWLFLSKILSLF